MLHRQLVGRSAFLHHVLHQVDPAARRIQFISEEQVSRACRYTEAAMNASAENFLGFRCRGIGQLGERKMRLHLKILAHMRRGSKMPWGSNASFSRRDNPASAGGCGSKMGTAARVSTGARTKVA